MFQADGYTLDSDHLDLTFLETSSWTTVGPPEFATPSQWVAIGDPVCGPGIQLGACGSLPQDVWIDRHYHGSDQFRCLVSGEFLLGRKRMAKGDFAFQKSGQIYREGLAGSAESELWMFLVHGDRRGARSTITRRDGSFPVTDISEDQWDRPVDSPDDPYWADLPGGAEGVPGVTATVATDGAGYSWGSFTDTIKWSPLSSGVVAAAGSFGNPEAGPIVVALHAEPAAVVLPAVSSATELVYVVVQGSSTIDGTHYGRGDIRIQQAGVGVDKIESGPDGLDAILLVADRREAPAAIASLLPINV